MRHQGWSMRAGRALCRKDRKESVQLHTPCPTVPGKGVNCIVQEHTEPFKSRFFPVLKWEGMKFTCLVISIAD